MKPFAVLLSSFVLVLGGPASAPAQEASPKTQEDAVAAIEKFGGRVTLDAKSGEVASVRLFGKKVTDAGMENLTGMTSLTDLSLRDTQITDAGLEHLKGMTSLETLRLAGTQITDAGLEHLKGMTSLNQLSLNDTQITDAGLEHLTGMTSLTDLSLRDTQITDSGLAEIKAALPKCRVFK